MKKILLGLGVLVAIGAQSGLAAEHAVFTPGDIKWMAAPPSVPKGAEAVVLYGDPSKEGPFALRLKMPANYTIPPHTHPKPEIVTIISGELNLGSGPTVDKANAKMLPAGSFFAMDPGMQHYVVTAQETVVQLNSFGPWALNYVNEKDDPRKQ
jgi:quercetin dioxygenase-like cupin family protein